MEQSLHINKSNVDYFEEIEELRVRPKRVKSRKERTEDRIEAINILNALSVEYGDITLVPDDNPKMKKARMIFGAFDDEIQKTNVQALRRRVAGLAKDHRIPQADVYRMLAYYLDLSPQTVKDKAYNNRFTRSEIELLWGHLEMLETIENLKLVIYLYNEKEEEYRQEKARINRSYLTET